jgi:hypothetical protein
LLCELLYCHRDRLRAWKADSALTRKLAFFNEGRREAVEQRTGLSNAIKSQLKVYFPLALELLNEESSTALAADLLLRWPSLEVLQKQSVDTARKFFYGHNCRGETKMLQRLELIQQARPLTQDSALIEPAAFFDFAFRNPQPRLHVCASSISAKADLGVVIDLQFARALMYQRRVTVLGFQTGQVLPSRDPLPHLPRPPFFVPHSESLQSV